MKRSFYIFVSRNKSPDLYINILGNFPLTFEGDSIDEIVLLNLAEDDSEKEKDLKHLKAIRSNIEAQIESLSNNKFIKWSKDGEPIGEPKSIKISGKFIEIYRNISKLIREEEITIKVILSSEIDRKIEKLVANYSQEYIFDLTGVTKRDFIRIGLLLLELKGNIYLFDMIKDFSRDEKDLIHELALISNSYSYMKLNPEKYSVVKNSLEVDISKQKEKLKKNLALGHTEDVLKELLDYLNRIQDEKSSFKDKLINASSRYFRYKNQYITGTIQNEKYELEINKINSLLIGIIEKF